MDLSVFAVVLVIAYLSADLAFRIQYLIMAVIALSPVAHERLEEMRDLCRIPPRARVHVVPGSFWDVLSRADQADLEVFGLPHERPLQFMASMVERTRASCLFLADSGEEDALA